MLAVFRGIGTNMKANKVCVVWPFISLFVTFNQPCFLWEISLSFAEDGLSSASPRGLCLLVGPTWGQKKTTAEKKKKKRESINTWTCAQRYKYCMHKHQNVHGA